MSCAGARGCSVDEQSRVIKCIRVHRRRESCAVRAAEDKRVMCVKAASETKERGRGEKKRSAREVVETASPRKKNVVVLGYDEEVPVLGYEEGTFRF